ncbi:MAG: hypothetical protein DCC71_23505, partial [Proteobacteria bacterium]
LVALHPVDARPLRSDADVRRLARRAGEDGVEALLLLREAELGARLVATRLLVERVRARGAVAAERTDLALRGEDVMRILGVGPGKRVGAALRYLTDCVLDDPACNTPEALAERLRRWAAETKDPA